MPENFHSLELAKKCEGKGEKVELDKEEFGAVVLIQEELRKKPRRSRQYTFHKSYIVPKTFSFYDHR